MATDNLLENSGPLTTNIKDILDSTPSCLKVISKTGHLISMNPRGLALIEAPNEQAVIGESVYDLVDEEFREQFVAFNERICSGEKGTLVFRITGLEGTKYWMETYAAPYQLSNGEIGHIAITNDVSDRIQAEHRLAIQQQALVKARRLASLGEMAAGIAHEINNPLSIIVGKNSQIRRRLDKINIADPDLEKHLLQLEETAFRAAEIIHGLQLFSRDSQNDEMSAYSLSEIVEQTVVLCQEKFRNSGIEIRADVDPSIQVLCKSVQVSQVLMNLLNNAKDALAESGAEKWVRISLVHSEEAKYVRLCVTDNGSGVAPEVVDNLMTPFFTTKEIGKGTGLGLSISMGIMEDHGGRLFYDKVSEGTRFVMEFPRER